MKSILDIPDAALLATTPLSDLVDEFCHRLKIEKPDVICLPLIDFGGANYPSNIIDRNSGPWAISDFLALAGEVKRIGSELYGSIIPSMNFLETSGLQTRTQYAREATGICLTNPASQKLLRACIDEAIDALKAKGIPTAGIVVDIVDINGMSASDNRIKLTCFCKYCTEALSRMGRFDYTVFKKFPNPINLFLRETPTGVSNFNVDLRQAKPEDVIELAKDYRIYDPAMIPESEADKWARVGLDYLEARSKVNAASLEQIGAKCRSEGVKYAVITGFSHFDFTAGTDMWHLTSRAVDQIWADTGDTTQEEIPAGVALYHYLSGRARYRIDAFFEIVSDVNRFRRIASGGTDAEGPVMDIVKRRGVTALTSNQLSRANVAALEFQETFEGYVGMPLSDVHVRRIVDKLEAMLPDMVPSSTKKTEASAAEVIMLLMRLAQSGRPIDMSVLSQIGKQLGLFAEQNQD